MTHNPYAVIIVKSTNHAVRAEKVLANAGLKCKLIPVPRQISSDCGVSLRVFRSEITSAQNALQEAGVETNGNYII